MPNRSPKLNAAIRAIQGETNLNAIHSALVVQHLASAIALAPNAHFIVRAIAALFKEFTNLLDTRIVANPALHEAVVQFIGTDAGYRILTVWAKIAPAGWGAAHESAIMDAVQNKKCNPSDAAALLGPCDTSAALLRDAHDAAFAVRLWGKFSPDAPTSWMDALSAQERERLLTMLQSNPHAVAHCMPWMPPDMANRVSFRETSLDAMLAVFVDASPTACALHAAFVKRLVAQAQSEHLGTLTRLACAMKDEEVWRRVQTLIRKCSSTAWIADVAVKWDDLDETERNAILECADPSRCALIAAAQGRRAMTALTISEHVSEKEAAVFFAALKPSVWDALHPNVQRQWLRALRHADHRVVRSLGLRPELLAKAYLTNDLVRAVQRHTCDDATLHWALFPVALRDLSPDESHALITDLPTPPPDPGAFFCIAGGCSDPNVLTRARAALRTRNDVTIAVTIQRCANVNGSIHELCVALKDALHERTWDDLTLIGSIFDDSVRPALMRDADALVDRLAHLGRKESLRQVLTQLANLPPKVAIPTRIMLNQGSLRSSLVAEEIADALHAYGDVFLKLMDALHDNRHREALLPLPKNAALADALCVMARENPLSAHRLAYALRERVWREALQVLLESPPRHANAVWRALHTNVRRGICTAVNVMYGKDEPMVSWDPIVRLALAALQAEDVKLHDAGGAALAARPARVRAIWTMLPQETQRRLRVIPDLADLPITLHVPAAGRSRIR